MTDYKQLLKNTRDMIKLMENETITEPNRIALMAPTLHSLYHLAAIYEEKANGEV